MLYSTYKSTFPFVIRTLTITVNYPEGSFAVNNTLGFQLLRARSILSQLEGQYSAIKSYIDINRATINRTYTKNVLIHDNIIGTIKLSNLQRPECQQGYFELVRGPILGKQPDNPIKLDR